MIPNGSIGLDKPTNWIGNIICKVTRKPVSHAKQYLIGLTWERTIWWAVWWWRSGIKITEGEQPADFYGEPIKPFTIDELLRMVRYWLQESNRRTPYNIPKLLALWIVEHNRKFFEKLGWIPFEHSGFGDLCSPTVDKAIKRAPRDALPGRREEATTPGDFFDSPLFEWYARGSR